MPSEMPVLQYESNQSVGDESVSQETLGLRLYLHQTSFPRFKNFEFGFFSYQNELNII